MDLWKRDRVDSIPFSFCRDWCPGDVRRVISLLEIAQGVAVREKLSDSDFSEVLRTIAGKNCKKARWEIAAMYPQSVETPYDQVRPLTTNSLRFDLSLVLNWSRSLKKSEAFSLARIRELLWGN
jgi:hypothetical protein